MRFLFDENLSHRLPLLLSDVFPHSSHVMSVNLLTASDEVVWNYALDHGFTIVSKDSDFRTRSLVEGHPPKVIWIQRGNCSTAEVAELVRDCQSIVLDSLANPDSSLLGCVGIYLIPAL